MEFQGVTFVGPEVDDVEVLGTLPPELQRLLWEVNGLVAFEGGLHLRGACHQPVWHSLHHVWIGERAFHSRYDAIREGDVPFAEDAVGDQWLLRDGRVVRLSGETGDLEESDQSLADFLAAVERDPLETLGLHPLLQFKAVGGSLVPGQLLNAYPPFCTEQSAGGVTLRAVPATEQLDFLAGLSRQLLSDGPLDITFTD